MLKNYYFLNNIKMSEKTLKFGKLKVNKKEFHNFKQQITLNLVNIDKIVISDKFEHTDKGSKSFIGYTDDNIIKPLRIFLPEMSE